MCCAAIDLLFLVFIALVAQCMPLSAIVLLSEFIGVFFFINGNGGAIFVFIFLELYNLSAHKKKKLTTPPRLATAFGALLPIPIWQRSAVVFFDDEITFGTVESTELALLSDGQN